MKCKPIVYFSPRHIPSPAITRALKALSRHVIIVGHTEEPEIAYSTINECDVFLFYLYPAVCRELFLMYELGVALVLGKPVIVIRTTGLKVSEVLIPKHFYETELLLAPNRTCSLMQTCNVFGKTCVFPITLGNALVCGYKNSIIFCPNLLPKCIALLLDRIFSVSREPGTLSRESSVTALRLCQNPEVRRTPLGTQSYSIQTETINKGRVSLPPLNKVTAANDKSKTASRVNQVKLGQLSVHEEEISSNYTPEISITQLESQGDHFTERSNLFNPVINEFPDEVKSPKERSEEVSDTSDSSSTCDVTFLHDKSLIASASTSPLPSPISPRGVYYPTALPVYPMELSFPPFQVEKLLFDKHAIQIAKADRLPSIIRRRLMRKDL